MWRQESTQRNAPPGLRPQRSRVSALRLPAALETRGLPSVASPFAGASDHRTLAFSRLTPRPSVCLRGSAEGPFFAPAFPASLESPVRTARGARARRGGDSLDPRLSPARPCPCGGRGGSFPRPLRARSSFALGARLDQGGPKKHLTSNHSRLTCVGLGFGCAPHSA